MTPAQVGIQKCIQRAEGFLAAQRASRSPEERRLADLAFFAFLRKEPDGSLQTSTCVTCGARKPVTAFPLRLSPDSGAIRVGARCKACRVHDSRQWYQANHARALVYQARYREERPDIRKAAMARWCEKNAEYRKQKDRERNLHNRDQRAKSNRAWVVANRHRVRANNDARRARQAEAPIRDLTVGEWLIVKDEFGGLCAYCGEPTPDPHREHVVPLSRGGSHTYTNIVPSCKSCNCRKKTKTADEFLAQGRASEFYARRGRGSRERGID